MIYYEYQSSDSSYSLLSSPAQGCIPSWPLSTRWFVLSFSQWRSHLQLSGVSISNYATYWDKSFIYKINSSYILLLRCPHPVIYLLLKINIYCNNCCTFGVYSADEQPEMQITSIVCLHLWLPVFSHAYIFIQSCAVGGLFAHHITLL